MHNTTKVNNTPSRSRPKIMTVPIYRYKFTETFSENLHQFSIIHELDDRETFKTAWKEWCEENSELISAEIERTTTLGYQGDIMQKMFKSARYYYRKKSTKKKAPEAPRKTYINLPEEILTQVDRYIRENPETKPSHGFQKFCEDNPEILRENAAWFQENGYDTSEEVLEKMKKTYKNRHFVIFHK